MADLILALSRISDDLWRESATNHGSVTWLPLWLVSSSGLRIGLDRNGRWVVGRLPGRASVSQENLSPGWLPILDHDESVAREEVAHAGGRYNLPVDLLLESLPVDDVIALALSTHNAHWIDRALIWLESRDIRDDIGALLPLVASSRSASQRARQRARRLIKGRSEPIEAGESNSESS